MVWLCFVCVYPQIEGVRQSSFQSWDAVGGWLFFPCFSRGVTPSHESNSGIDLFNTAGGKI